VALSEKCFVAHDKPHDNRFVIPEPVSSRTRRKLQLGKCDGKQVISTAEVYSEMEPSSEDEEVEISATCKRSQTQAMCSSVNDAVSREIACGLNWGSATLQSTNFVHMQAVLSYNHGKHLPPSVHGWGHITS